jgi:SAM-dependent methyltransferase
MKINYFVPGPLGLLFNPHYLVRRGIYKGLEKYSEFITDKTLDFGCGSKPYEHIFTHSSSYIGIDVEVSGHDHEKSKIDVLFDGINIPFPDNTYSSVICSEVLEHIFEPDVVLQQINRVMKPGGYIILTVPFAFPEHEIPYDYSRYSSYGIKYLLEKNNFEVIQNDKINSSITTIGVLINSYFASYIPKIKILKHILAIISFGSVNTISLLLEFLMPQDKTLYTNNIILARKIRISE